MSRLVRKQAMVVLPHEPTHCSIAGVECLSPIEASIKLVSVYLAEDTTLQGNVGRTAAIYGNAGCELVEQSDGLTSPNLGTCGIDVGTTSSAGHMITATPRYIDLAGLEIDLRIALDAGWYAVPVDTYRDLQLEAGFDTRVQDEGTQDTLPAGTAMNVRFFAEGMPAPYEIRKVLSQSMEFPFPVSVAAGQQLVVNLTYDLSGVVYSVAPGIQGLPPTAQCTPPVGAPAKHYCFDGQSLNLRPIVVGTAAIGTWDDPGSLWDAPQTLWGP